MKQQDLEDALDIASLLEAGTASRRDLVAFLIYIREHIPNDMVRDICHFVAHDRCDRGIAFDYTEGFVSHVISVFGAGGAIQVRPVYEIDVLLKQLCQDTQSLGINLDLAKLSNHCTELINILSELLDGVTFELKNSQVNSCTFEIRSDSSRKFLMLIVETHGLPAGIIAVPRNVKLVFPFFD